MTQREHARQAGARTYSTGRPCKAGHVAERYTADKSCVECAKARADLRRALKPDAVAAEKRNEYVRNKAQYVGKAAEWRKANPERSRRHSRAWHGQHPDKSYAVVVARRMAKLRRTPSWLTKEQRGAIAELYRLARSLTQSTGVAHQVDHIVPLRGAAVSGLHVPWNLQVLTAHQNRSKGNRLAA